MVIGNVQLDTPVFLAPLAGFTDLSFRSLCREFGCDGTVSEMISAKGLEYENANTKSLLKFAANDTPFSVQLFGRDPDILADAVKKIEDILGDNLLSIDLNMGCPVPKVVKNGEGSALMLEPQLAGKIVRAMSDAASVPVSVKIRKGFDKEHINADFIAGILEDNGASFLTVHGRTREQMYSGKSDRAIIRKVKESVRIPVFGNGDVTDGRSALELLRDTGCDGIMIGRGALGNPWIFREIHAACSGKAYTSPTYEEKIRTAIRHAEMTVTDKGSRGVIELRKHIGYYIKGSKGATEIRSRLQYAKDLDSLKEILLDTVQNHQYNDGT